MLRAANTNLVGEMRPRTKRQSCQAKPPTTKRLDASCGRKGSGHCPDPALALAVALARARLAEAAENITL